MFDALQSRFTGILDKLKRRGVLSEEDVDAALAELRVSLIDADVALSVVDDFLSKVRERSLGEAVLRSVTPGQQVVRIVYDAMVEMLGSDGVGLSLGAPPAPILLVGLQGSGKTTTAAKLALHLRNKDKKRVLMASLDASRPAAMEQLKVLGEQAGIATLPVVANQRPSDIAKRALAAARVGGYDALILDTAGRQHIDEKLMEEASALNDVVKPHEILLVADSLTGQDAVNIANSFHARMPLSGIILTRADGDARGGAALSMRAVTGAPIKFLGMGEKLDALEPFHPERVAQRILDMGDVVTLVEKAAESFDREQAEKLARKMKKGDFDFDDLAEQLRQMRKMGGMEGLLAMLPGVGKAKEKIAAAGFDDTLLKRQEAIVQSMTRNERAAPELLNGSRRKRIAKGAGVDVAEVNRLCKMHRQMADMMKRMGKGGRSPFGAAGMNPQMLAQLGGLPPGTRK